MAHGCRRASGRLSGRAWAHSGIAYRRWSRGAPEGGKPNPPLEPRWLMPYLDPMGEQSLHKYHDRRPVLLAAVLPVFPSSLPTNIDDIIVGNHPHYSSPSLSPSHEPPPRTTYKSRPASRLRILSNPRKKERKTDQDIVTHQSKWYYSLVLCSVAAFVPLLPPEPFLPPLPWLPRGPGRQEPAA